MRGSHGAELLLHLGNVDIRLRKQHKTEAGASILDKMPLLLLGVDNDNHTTVYLRSYGLEMSVLYGDSADVDR